MVKKLPVKVETVNDAGDVTKTETVNFSIMPPHPDACQVCGHNPAHAPEEPHNASSMYYQYAFYGEHGRWPTWKDAMAHCDAKTQAFWTHHLRERGQKI